MTIMETIGKKLSALRNQAGETQEQVAQAVDITTVSLSRYENGQRMPRMNILNRLARHYGVAIDEILGRQEQIGLKLDEQHIIDLYRKLTDEGKQLTFKYLLLLQHEYRRSDDAES